MLTKDIVRKIQKEFEEESTAWFLCVASDTFSAYWDIEYERDAIKLLAAKLIRQGLLKDAQLSFSEQVLFNITYRNDQKCRDDRKLFLEELLKSDLI